MGVLRRRILLGNGNDVGYTPGIYAYYSDGSLKTFEEADSNAIGVAVITMEGSFVIDKTDAGSGIYRFGGYNKDLSSTAVTTEDESTARADFRGETNTTNIISACAGYNDGWTTGAAGAEACRAMFSGKGYMGALGEWSIAYRNKPAIDAMMTKIGGTAISTDTYYWTSTHYYAPGNTWIIIWSYYRAADDRRYAHYHTRAFLRLDVPVMDYVDLGLPSGTLWCTGNICKNGNVYYIGSATDYGAYFSWGNVEGYNKGEGYDFSTSTYSSTPGASLTGDIQSTDYTHDAALACLGNGYRMPTKDEFQELFDNCSMTWVTSYNGISINGAVLKSNRTGHTDKEIFLPAGGYYNGTTLHNYETYCYQYSSTYYSSTHAYSSDLYNTGHVSSYVSASYREAGQPVRAVRKK